MSEQDRTARQPGRPDPPVESPEESIPPESPAKPTDDWPVRRALIRATLKLPEGTAPAPRQPPVFTMHQQTRGGDGGNSGNRANGNVRNSRSASWDNGHPNRQNEKNSSSRPARRNDRNGQSRNGSPSRPAASRRGRGRSR